MKIIQAMKQSVDSLFQKKLKNFQVEAPASAWDRIDTNLGKQKGPFFWIRIAASLLFVTVVGYSIFSVIAKKELPIAMVEKSKPMELNSSVAETHPIVQPQEATQNENQEVKQSLLAIDNSDTKKIYTSKSSPKNVVPQQTDTPEITLSENVLLATNTVDEVAIPDEKIDEPMNTTTIRISAEEANAKYLNEPFIADATTENKKSSKLRDLFEKAQDMDPIGEIRQLKNEVLALNFKSEKKGERNR